MADSGVDPIQRLMLELGRLPGVGERSAARLAYYITQRSRGRQGHSLAHDLATALLDVDARVRLCAQCRNLTTEPQCAVCRDGRRNVRQLCVVEGVADLRALERAGGFTGTYYVLHGVLAPLDGVGPDDLALDGLQRRVAESGVQEVILAMNQTLEGDATALYLAQLLRADGVLVTKLASGVPLGGELEYLDGATLGRALQDRKAV